jgi:hypothetical protein
MASLIESNGQILVTVTNIKLAGCPFIRSRVAPALQREGRTNIKKITASIAIFCSCA